MDRDRIEGSLLNKAYEVQCLQERQFNMMDMLTRMDLQQEATISSEDRLFMTAVRPRTQPVSLTVVAGRVVNSSAYPVNGQQLQLQLDQLTSAMTDMMVEDEEMEAPVNTQYTQYIQDRTGIEADPFSQDEKRRDPVYLSSMAAHIAPPLSHNNTQQQQQQQQVQEQQQKQEYFLAFLHQQQITQEQFVQQQQYYQQLLEHQYAQEQQLAQQQQQLAQQQQQEILQHQQLSSGCCMQNDGGRRLMKRPDLLPMQKCTMWT